MVACLSLAQQEKTGHRTLSFQSHSLTLEDNGVYLTVMGRREADSSAADAPLSAVVLQWQTPETSLRREVITRV